MNKSAQYHAYNLANRTVGKTRQVVMLYDGIIRFIKQAKQAIEENRIEDRYKLLTKATEVLVGLQGSLDFEQGGTVARTLHDFYISMESRLMSIHRTHDTKVCEELINELKQMRDVWDKIDKEQNHSTSNNSDGGATPAGSDGSLPPAASGQDPSIEAAPSMPASVTTLSDNNSVQISA